MYLKSADIPDGVVVEAPKALTQRQADSKLLQAAAGHLRRGWCRGVFAITKDGDRLAGHQVLANKNAVVEVCARGALFMDGIIEGSMTEHRLSRHLVDQLISEEGGGYAEWAKTVRDQTGDLYTLPLWNNARERTQEEVVGLFERTASRLESA